MKKLDRKRQRGKNFTHDEEMLLLELVKVEKNVLENKKSDAKTWKEKEETWEKLTKQFVSQIGINRTARTLRDKYESLKRNSRRKATTEVADEQRETYHKPRCVSPVSEKIFDLLGVSATGLSKIFDSDYSVSNDCSTSNEQSDHETSSFTNADDMQETHEESKVANCWHPAKLTDMKSPKVNISNNDNNRNCSLEQEKLFLTRLQQDYYRSENIRAEEKHVEEQKLLHLKNELLEQQHDFYRNENVRAEEKHMEEQKTLRLKNELLELEILERKQKLITISESGNEHKLETV